MHGSSHGSRKLRGMLAKRGLLSLSDELTLNALQNASWSINTLKVYKKVTLSRPVNGAARRHLGSMPVPVWLPFVLALCVLVA